MKRLLAILLVLAMLPVPAAFAERETSGLITDADRAAVDAMWKELENAEGEELESRKSYRSAVTVVEESTAFAVAYQTWHFTVQQVLLSVSERRMNRRR